MYVRGLIPRNFAELTEAVPIGRGGCLKEACVHMREVTKSRAIAKLVHIKVCGFFLNSGLIKTILHLDRLL